MSLTTSQIATLKESIIINYFNDLSSFLMEKIVIKSKNIIFEGD